ncbi:MAG: nucleotidyltransferase, partial [Rhodobacterales bacterium]
MARRVLSIWFARLASDLALRRRPLEGAFALTHRAGGAEHLHCLNSAAEALGLHRGMTLADARALCPDLITRPADLRREQAGLAALRRWAGRYSPIVARDGADGLVADISGVAHLFGGEDALQSDLHARLERAGFTAASAIAGTRGAAFALARHGGGIVAEGALAEGIGHLPVSALRIDHASCATLARLGLTRIADLTALPRASLGKRFGPGLLMRLDQALGAQAEPVSPEPDLPCFTARLSFPDPIGLHADMMAALERLLARLCALLARHARGARRVRLELHRVDKATLPLEIGLARPMRDAARIAALFGKHLERVDAGYGIEAMRLAAPVTEPLEPEQIGRGQAPDDLADLFSTLGNRLGFDRVQRLLPAQSRIPERSFLIAPAAYSAPETPPAQTGPERPVLIFPPEPVTCTPTPPGRPPMQFRWRRMRLTTLRATGPERITPEWWFDDPNWRTGLRDYWRLETREGPR